MKNSMVLWVALALIGFGVYNNPNLNWNNNQTDVVAIDVVAPTDPILLEKAKEIGETFKEEGGFSRKSDALEFAKLMGDLALAISLEGDKEAVSNTSEVREINSMSGHMMELKMKDKYPKTMALCNELVKGVLGDDIVPLAPESRKKAVEAFRAICWGAVEGSK